MAHSTPPAVVLSRAESDARFGGFDFRAAHAEADADLRELLDNTESLPFRRRGYERDGMLKTVVEHAGELPGPMHVVLVATHASVSHRTTTGFKEI